MSMERVEVDGTILESIARSSEGCVRDAESLLGQVLALRDAKNKISREQAELVIPKSDFNLVGDFVGYLAARDAEKALRLVNKLVEEGIDLSQFTADLVEFLRKILLAGVSGSLKEFSFDLDDDSEKKIIQLAKDIEPRRLIDWLELFIEKRQELKFADIAQLPLEMAVVEIVGGFSAAKEMAPPPTKPSGGGSFSEERPKIKPLPKKEEKDKVEDVAPAVGVNETNLTLEQLKEKWFDLLRVAADRSPSLVFYLARRPADRDRERNAADRF